MLMEQKNDEPGSVDNLLEWPDNLLFGRPLSTEELRTAVGPQIEDVERAREALGRVAKRCSSFVQCENARQNKLNLDRVLNAINVVGFFFDEYNGKENILSVFLSKRKFIEPYTDILLNDNNTLLLNFREIYAVTNFLVKFAFPFCFTDFGRSFRGSTGLATLYLYFVPISLYVVEDGPNKQKQREKIVDYAYEHGVSQCHGKTLFEVASDLYKNGFSGDAHKEAMSAARNYMFISESDDDLNTLVANIIFISLVYFMEIWEVFISRQNEMAIFFNRVKNKRLVFRIISIMFSLKETALIGIKCLDGFDMTSFLQSCPGDVGAVKDLFNMYKLIVTRGVDFFSEFVVNKCILAFSDIDDMDDLRGKTLSKEFFVIMNKVKKLSAFDEIKAVEFIFDVIEREEEKGPAVTKKMAFFLKVLNFVAERKMFNSIPETFARMNVPKVVFTPERMNSLSYIKFLLNANVRIPQEALKLFTKVNTQKQVLKALKMFMMAQEAMVIFDKVVESIIFTLEPSGGEELFDILRKLFASTPELRDRFIDALDNALSINDYRERIKIVERTSWIIDGLYPEKATIEKIIDYKGSRIVKGFFGDVVSKKTILMSKFANTFKALLLIDEHDRIIPFIRVLFCAKPVPEDQAYLFRILALKGDFIFSCPACIDAIINAYENCADPSNKLMLEVAHDFLIETKSKKYFDGIIGIVDRLMDKFLGFGKETSPQAILTFAESFFDALYWMSLKNGAAHAFIYTTMFSKLVTSFKKLVYAFKAVVDENPASVKAAALPFGRIIEHFLKNDADGTLDEGAAMYAPGVKEAIREIWLSPSVMMAIPEDFQNGIVYNVSQNFIRSLNENSSDTIVTFFICNYLPLIVSNEKVWTIFHGVICKFQEQYPKNAWACFTIIQEKIQSLIGALGSDNEEEFTKTLSYMNALIFYFSSTLVFVDKYGMTTSKINITESLKMLETVLNTILANECAKSVLLKSKDAQNDLLDIASGISTSVVIVAAGQNEPSFPTIDTVDGLSDELMKTSVFPFPNPHVRDDVVMDVICSMIPALEYVGPDKAVLLDKIIEVVGFMHVMDIPHLEKHFDNIMTVLEKCVRGNDNDECISCYDIVVVLLTLLMWQPEDDAFNFTYKIAKLFVTDGQNFDLFKCYQEYLPLKKNDLRILFLATRYTIVLTEDRTQFILNPNIDDDRMLILSEDGLNSDDFKSKLFIFEKLASIISDKKDSRSDFASRVLASLLLRVPVLQYYAYSVYSGDVVVEAFTNFFQHRGVSFELEECSKFLSRYTMGTAVFQKLLAKTYCTILDSFISENDGKDIVTAESVPIHLLSLSEILSVFIHFVANPREKAGIIRILINSKVPQKLCSGIIGRIDFNHFKEQPQKDPISTLFVLVLAIVKEMTPKSNDDKFVSQWDISLKTQELKYKDRLTSILMRLMGQEERSNDEINPTGFDTFTTWINDTIADNAKEPESQGSSLLSKIRSPGDGIGDNVWVYEQRLRMSEMNEEFHQTETEHLNYDISFETDFKNVVLADFKGVYSDIFSKYVNKHLITYDPKSTRENPELDMDIAIIVSALDSETQEMVLRASGKMLSVLMKYASGALGIEKGSPMKIEGVDTNINVAATAIATQNAFSSPEVIVPLLKMLYCTDECFPAEVVNNILSFISRIPSLSSTVFDLIISLMFVIFKTCDGVSEEEYQELISGFLHRSGANLDAFADNPLFKSLLCARVVVSDGYTVFKSVSESGEASVYGDVHEGVPDLTSQAVTRLFSVLRSMVMDKDKGVPISQKQFSMLLSVMAVTLNRFFNTLSIDMRARIVAFTSALTSYVKVNHETMFMMPRPTVECLVEIVPKFDILPELSGAYFNILKTISRCEVMRSFMEDAFYDECNSAADNALTGLKSYNNRLSDILDSDSECRSRDLVGSVANLRIGATLSRLLSAMYTVYLSNDDARKRSSMDEFIYDLTDQGRSIVDRIMPVLEKSLVLLDRLSSKEAGWPKGDRRTKYFKSVASSISVAINIVINRLVVNMKTVFKENYEEEEENGGDEIDEEFIFDDSQEQNQDPAAERDVEMDVENGNDEEKGENEDEKKENEIEIEMEDDDEPTEKSNSLEEFYAKHSGVINKVLKADPSLIINAFYPLIYIMPDVIDFESKQFWFKKEIEALRKTYSKDKTVIKIRRANILSDSFNEFFKKYKMLKYPISVVFEGEEASDAGGPRREWYQEISRSIADPKFGLFTQADNGTIQPNPLSEALNPRHLEYFRFVGLVVGKALWDSETIDLHFVHSFYKRILSKPITMHDMEAKDHEYYESLMSILSNPGAENLGLDFTVQLNDNGKSQIVPLVPNGEDIEVNDQNKKRYVELVINFELVKSTMKQTREFIRGFREFIPKRLTKPFTETQLELLISGMPVIDVEDLRKNTIYCNGYTPTSDIVTWFWRAVESYSGEEKAMLLQFITGSGKVPAGGFNSLVSTTGGPIKIYKSGSVDRLPTTHTCFNQIEIPPYESYEKLYEKLTMAIYCGYKGFGFI